MRGLYRATAAAALFLAALAAYAQAQASQALRFDRKALQKAWAQGDAKQQRFLSGLDAFEREVRARLPAWACAGPVTVEWSPRSAAPPAAGKVVLAAPDYMGNDRTLAWIAAGDVAAACLAGESAPALPTASGMSREKAAARLMDLGRDALALRLRSEAAGIHAPTGSAAWELQRRWSAPQTPLPADVWRALEEADADPLLAEALAHRMPVDALPAGAQERCARVLEWLESLAAEGNAPPENALLASAHRVVNEYFPAANAWSADLRRAEDLANEKKWIEALKLVLAVQKKNPHEPEICVRLARIYLGMGQPEQAVGWLESAAGRGFSAWGILKTAPFDEIADHPRLGSLKNTPPRY